MSDITTREFEGFQIEDNDSYVVSINQRSGPINLNCQEVMAVALANDCIYGNGQTDKDIVNVYKRDYAFVSHGNIYNLRATPEWKLARESFVSLNPNLTDDQKNRLAKSDSQKNGNSSGDTIKFTATHAGNLGKAIFAGLPNEHKKYVANFDLSNEAFSDNTNLGKVVREGIKGFANGVKIMTGNIKWQSERAAREKAEQERAEQEKATRQKAEQKAKAMLVVMGSKPEDADYQEKLNGLVEIMISE